MIIVFQVPISQPKCVDLAFREASRYKLTLYFTRFLNDTFYNFKA